MNEKDINLLEITPIIPNDLFKLINVELNKILEKVGEESTESIIAAKDFAHCDKSRDKAQYDEARHELIYEVADVWFHTLVGLAWFDIESDAVLGELGRRFGLSGIDEKAAR